MVLKRFLRVPWTTRRSNQSILKEISLEYSLERLMVKPKLQNFGHLMWPNVNEELAHWKRSWCWGRLKAKEKRVAEDEIVRQHHWLNGHEFDQNVEDSEGQGNLACCNPWSHKRARHNRVSEHACTHWLINLVHWIIVYHINVRW